MSLLATVSTQLRWALNNGVWAFGTDSYAELVPKANDYTVNGLADQINAPTLIMDAENDQFLKGEPQWVKTALTNAEATLVTLTIAEGAGEHTHAGALARAHQIMFEWLDATLASRTIAR
jgi:alpha-beta hydrolase superfamily lysophospholipase